MTRLFRRAGSVIVDTIELAIDPNNQKQTLDVAFVIERSLKPEPNKADIQIWNLNADHRSQLENLGRSPGTVAKGTPPPTPPAGIGCEVTAGYEEQTAIIYSGTLRVAYTVREGPNLVTHLQSGDGAKEYQRSRVNVSIAKGTPNDALIKKLQKALGIKEGNLSKFTSDLLAAPKLLPQGGVLSGSASQVMTRAAQSLGFEWSIQEGALQLLKVNAPLNATAVLLKPDTGLVGTPSVDINGVLTAKALLIPDIFPGRLLVLETERLSGNYRIEKTKYTGSTFGNEWHVDFEASKL